MKTLIILIILSLCCRNLYQYSAISDYIEIKHTGREDMHIRTLVISTKMLNKNVFLKDIDSMRTLSLDEKNDILNLRYFFSKTDTITYQSIIDFCNTNKYFFTDKINKNHGDYRDYSIEVEGKKYQIFYQKEDQFFKNLVDFIKARKGDKSLIEQLSAY